MKIKNGQKGVGYRKSRPAVADTAKNLGKRGDTGPLLQAVGAVGK